MKEYVIMVSDHALDRIRERSGINKKAAQKLAERAYNNGIKHSETKGNLNKFISSLTNKHRRKGTEIRLYGDKVFIFNRYTKDNLKRFDDNGNIIITLVTVLQIPSNLSKSVTNIKVKKKEQV